MALRPGKYEKDGYYFPSSLQYPDGRYGSDGTQGTDNIIYIGNRTSKRVIAFKAFIDNFDYNITKNTEEIIINSFNSRKQLIENNSLITFGMTLNVPAHSFNESRNNLAKIVEMQRMIAPSSIISGDPGDVTADSITKAKVTLMVFFKNLLNSGAYFNTPPVIDDFELLSYYGVAVYCMEIKYEPDLEMGFFDAPNNPADKYLYPKNIKLQLSFTVIHEHVYPSSDLYINGYTTNGIYRPKDPGYSPFNVAIQSDEEEPNKKLYKQTDNINQSTLNTIKNSRDGFIYISNSIENNTGKRPDKQHTYKIFGGSDAHKRRRYVMFDNFINNFSRDVKFDKIENTDVSKDFASGYEKTKYSAVTYNLGFDVPSASVEEAIKNLGKLQILSRLLAKKQKSTWFSSQPDIDPSIGRISKWSYVNNSTDVSVYVPGMIEIEGASRSLNNTSYTSCLNNSLDLSITTMDIKFSTDMGFFERNGKLYPKHYTINLIMIEKDMSLAKNFSFKEDSDDATGGVNVLDTDTALLFPFNRKYTKITTG